MRLMAIGKWSKEQRRWLTVIALARKDGGRPAAKTRKPRRSPAPTKQ